MGKTREEIGNIMEMTWEINVFIIIVSNTAPWLRILANVAKVVKFFGNIMAVTRQTKHVIIVLSKIATKRRGNQMAFSLSKVVKNFGSTLPMTENELCAIIVSSKIVAAGF